MDKLHNEIIAVILPPPRIRPGKRIRVTSVTRWRPVQKKQLEFYRIAIARTLMIMMVVPVLEINFGPPSADFGSIWSFQKARKFRLIQLLTKTHILCFVPRSLTKIN